METKPLHDSQTPRRREKEAELRKQYPMLEGGAFFTIDCVENYELIRELTSFGADLICLAVHQLVGSPDGYPHIGVSPAVLRLDAYSDVPLSQIPNAVAAFVAVEGYVSSGVPIVGGMTWIHMRQLRFRRVVSTQRLVLTGHAAAPSSTTGAPLYREYITPEAFAAALAAYRRHHPAPARR